MEGSQLLPALVLCQKTSNAQMQSSQHKPPAFILMGSPTIIQHQKQLKKQQSTLNVPLLSHIVPHFVPHCPTFLVKCPTFLLKCPTFCKNVGQKGTLWDKMWDNVG